ncbi:MAG: adenylate/guanylate cyclase domain-containing protein [Rhodospirillaceae bacterium]
MSYWTDLRTPTELELFVGIYDLTKYTLYSERTEPLRLLELVAAYHALANNMIEDAGGILIKPIGDAGLFAFQAAEADTAVETIETLLEKGDAWLEAEGYPGRAAVVAHVGLVAVGRIKSQEREWLDIIGRTVNVVGVMRSFRFTMTPAAFRRLSPTTRKRFRKHTPPASYIGIDDPRPRSYWRGYEGGYPR